MFAGQLACEAANFVLKRLIKEERPPRIQVTGKGYGMPSSHAQFAAFWAVSLGLFLVARHRPRARAASPTAVRIRQAAAAGSSGARIDLAALEHYAHQPWSVLERVVASIGALGLAGAVAWSRTYLGYHTPKQVLVGSAAGAVCAVGWFAVTSVARQTGLLAWLLETPVARSLRIRDLVVEEDLCQAGWEKWEGSKAAAQQKKSR